MPHIVLSPYCELPESKKENDRDTVISTLKLIYKMGYKLYLQVVERGIPSENLY